MKDVVKSRAVLVTGGVAAILASTCCLGPLVLIVLGFSGAWISNLTLLEAYRPLFLLISLLTMYFAGRRIWRTQSTCMPDARCFAPEVKASYKILFGVVAMLVLLAFGFPYVMPFFY
jgi:mercuric ion transport protein